MIGQYLTNTKANVTLSILQNKKLKLNKNLCKPAVSSKALFSSKIFWKNDNVTFLFLFDKHCPIRKKLGLKDLSRDLQIKCVINFYFYLYLMLYACDARFDMTENLEFFFVFRWTKALFSS